MIRQLFALCFFLLIVPTSIAQVITRKHASHWSEKSVFFGVNQAWDYTPSPRTVLTFIARDEGRKFQYDKFDEKNYLDELKKVRMLALKYIGIKDWVPEKLSVQRQTAQSILVKVEGHYVKESGKVFFTEWQLFEDHLYSQLSLIEPDGPELKRVPTGEKNQVMREILRL